MQMTGRTRPFSAVTSKRSMRLGFSRGSAALATISSRSMLATTTCCRPRTAREMVPCRGSTRSMKPSFCAASSAGRTSTRSPAATTFRWSVLRVFSSRRVAHWKMRPSSARTVLVSPSTESTRPRQQAARPPPGNVQGRLVAAGSLRAADGAVAGQLALAADPLATAAGASSWKPCASNWRVQSVRRARTLRFLRNSARIFRSLPISAVGSP